MNYDVVIDMLSSEVQKPTLALIDSQHSDVKSVFQNIALSAMRYYLLFIDYSPDIAKMSMPG